MRMLPRRSKSKIPRWAGAALLVVLTLLLMAGIRVDFFPSPAWSRLSLFVVLVITAWPMWAVGRSAVNNPVEGREFSSPAIRALVGWVLIPFVVYFGSWIVVAHSIPDLITRVAGSSFSETHVLTKHHEHSRRSCDYCVKGKPFDDRIGRDYYCAWISEYERLPDKGPMLVRGRRTWFGRHVDSIEPSDPPMESVKDRGPRR